jgi:transposase
MPCSTTMACPGLRSSCWRAPLVTGCSESRCPPAGRRALGVALGQIDQVDADLDPIDAWLRGVARRQPGCRALIAAHYGIGAVTAPTILAELGDARRFAGGDQVVRATGLDITVWSSAGRRSPGRWP